jgi:ribonucleoside-triphosphate reductase
MNELANQCSAKTEVYSRIVGYFRPVQQWNIGKKQEYFCRKTFEVGLMDDKILEFPVTANAPAATPEPVSHQGVSRHIAH